MPLNVSFSSSGWQIRYSFPLGSLGAASPGWRCFSAGILLTSLSVLSEGRHGVNW